MMFEYLMHECTIIYVPVVCVSVVGCFFMLLYLLCSDEEDFPPEASSLLVELVNGAVLQAQVVAMEEDQVPYVLLAKPVGNQV